MIDFAIGLLLLIIDKMIKQQEEGTNSPLPRTIITNIIAIVNKKMSALRFLGIFFIAAGCTKLIWYLVEQTNG